MPTPTRPGDVSTDLASGSTAASGSVDLNLNGATPRPTSLVAQRRYRIFCSCAGSITWNLNVGAVTGRRPTKESKSGTSAVFVGDDGPFEFATLAWSGNSGSDPVYIDVHTEKF